MPKEKPDNNPKVSVIVPVYNVELYLTQCIESILSQNFIDFELILINDGSTDTSGNICKEYVLKDSRVQLFHQSNAGASAARNRGISEAKGDFICFVDSDDWVEENYLSDFLFNTSQDESSLVIQPYIYYDYTNDWQKSEWRHTNYEKQKYVGSEIVQALLLSNFFISTDGGPVCKLFRKKVIIDNTLIFSPGISAYEDVVFSLKYISKIDILYISNSKNYHYIHRPLEVSLSKRKHLYSEYLFSANEGADAIEQLFSRYNITDALIVNIAKNKMFEIKLMSIYALYSSEILVNRQARLTLLNSLKILNKDILQNHYFPKTARDLLIKKILLIKSAYVADYIFVLLFHFKKILKNVP